MVEKKNKQVQDQAQVQKLKLTTRGLISDTCNPTKLYFIMNMILHKAIT